MWHNIIDLITFNNEFHYGQPLDKFRFNMFVRLRLMLLVEATTSKELLFLP